MARIAILSMHTSPLAQPGTGDGGGMNVYVRELASALARSGNRCEVFTRRESPQSPKSINVEPGFVVHYVDAGPLSAVPKERLEELVPEFTEHVLSAMRQARWSDEPAYDVIHANYWLSGLAGHTLKHELDIPLISTFHTLDRVKAEAMPEEVVADISQRRAEAEALVIGCSDAVLASCDVEANQLVDLYGADRSRIAVIPPGVDHAFFGPGESAQARRALGLASNGSLLLFVGRIQPLKGAHIAVATLACLRDQGEDVHLVIVGGPSGDQGDATLRGLNEQVSSLGMEEFVLFRPPQPHEQLSSYYRAADVTIVPSRSESFGLVALESLACGTPVVASAVGGLTTLVDDGITGALIESTDPMLYARAVATILHSELRDARYSTTAVLHARQYSWRSTALQLGALFEEMSSRRLVTCA